MYDNAILLNVNSHFLKEIIKCLGIFFVDNLNFAEVITEQLFTIFNYYHFYVFTYANDIHFKYPREFQHTNQILNEQFIRYNL